MTILHVALIIFAIQTGVPVWAKVVDSFDECSQFFYNATAPKGMDQNATKICQKYGHGGSFYASLYSTFHRIPLYSAFTFDNNCSQSRGQRSNLWFIEPQLSEMRPDTMQPEANYDRDTLKRSQALSEDYSNTVYDRGHLNPNSFQCEDGRKATFTLTNSAPMDASFNRVDWKRWEDAVKYVLMEASPVVDSESESESESMGGSEGGSKCESVCQAQGTAYIVTGTIPSDNYRVPRRGEFDPPNSTDFHRVTVPTHIWSAVCFKSNVDDEQSFSFGYIGLNQGDSRINVKTVPQLNFELSLLYRSNNLQVFADDCYSSNNKSEEVIQHLYHHIQLPFSDKLAMSEETLNLFHTAITQFDDVQAVKRSRSTRSGKGVGDYIGNGKSCLSHHKCGYYDEGYTWCYNDHNWDYCCSKADHFSALNRRTCLSDHPCGFHGYRYLWCYTTDDTWDYCCTPYLNW